MEHHYPPPSDQYYREPSPPPPPPGDYYRSPPPQPPPAYPPAYTQAYPPPPHSSEKRHKSKSRSHRHEQPHHTPPAAAPPALAPVPPIPNIPPPAVRICRVLTLLIEDKRNPDGESMLAEVRVPLKQADPGDEGFWADAQEVSEELQKGPSRIDGQAKVYTQRGKYKQYFLRISGDGEHVCQPANLKVAPDRTLEIVIEDVSSLVLPYLVVCF
ncbi:hypothetical protein BV20DRAFT_937418 [Pilatotrama ljubarskyi]|nr:hypothetical protein BV20DRAFT_937418 [Pilatotrama ljubarskyi]